MERRFVLKALAIGLATAGVGNFSFSWADSKTSQSVPLSFDISGPGRIGFYQDYSELVDVGTHTFYVARTHGSQGEVGCSWAAYSSYDGSKLAEGRLSWQDKSIDIKVVSVNVPEKRDGDHRIYVALTNPSGGAILHHEDNSVAYGIIEDGTIATSDAIFIDADAIDKGEGTESSPFNNWYDARDAVTLSTRFIYIKGKMVPDGTDPIAMSNAVKNFGMRGTFEGRTSEAQRLVIRNWPGFEGGIDGGGQNDCAGFVCDGGASDTNSVKFITFRGLTVTNLNNSAGGRSAGKCFFIRTRSFGDSRIEKWTAENIKISGIESGANAATAVWYSESCKNFKIWRWHVENTSYAFKEDQLTVFLCYRTDNVSIQRCTFEESAGGIYEKEGISGETKTGISIRFNHFKGSKVRISTQGGKLSQDFHIIQSNLFDTPSRGHNGAPLQFDMNATDSDSSKQLISNNIFYNYSFSTAGDITVKNGGWNGMIIFNNIFFESKRPWRFNTGVSEPEVLDFNHYHNSTIPAPVFRYLEGDETLQAIRDKHGVATHSSEGDPKFAEGSWRLLDGSPCSNSGISGSDKGLYLTGYEVIGANDLADLTPPAKMAQPNVSVIEQ